MALSRRLVCRFQRLYLDKYGDTLTYSQAEAELQQLARVVRVALERKT